MSIWSAARFPETSEPSTNPDSEHRSRFQQDYDRLLFSTPVRRLSDKTQVWPMDENDGVRTRLTHSHEVANLAKSIGTRVFKKAPSLFSSVDLHETIQPLLSSIGLVHDLGNPPFGHQGEEAIKRWFNSHKSWIFSKDSPTGEGLPHSIEDKLRSEFLDFDGNPQTLRLITKLQTSVSNVGLGLTAATLAASLKYPVGARNQVNTSPIAKKFGYFESEMPLINWIREQTGLVEGQRHPLTWIMEACDDIAYSVLDVDDAMKKNVVSPDDVVEIISSSQNLNNSSAYNEILLSFKKVRDAAHRPEVARDIKISYLRATFIGSLIKEASDRFIENSASIMNYTYSLPIMDSIPLCDKLKSIARQYAFGNPSVLKMEAKGAEAITGLMSVFGKQYQTEKRISIFHLVAYLLLQNTHIR